jgi:hypothetical protein
MLTTVSNVRFTMSAAADGVTPIRLSRGLHRSASDGACLMELASLLAGDPWSDHPASVHPVLGAVARAVNDRVSDTTRGRLAPLAPLMVGTAGADVESCARLVVLCTAAALNQTSFVSSDLHSARRRAWLFWPGRKRRLPAVVQRHAWHWAGSPVNPPSGASTRAEPASR